VGTGFASDRALVIEERMIFIAKPLTLWRIMRSDRIGATFALQGSQRPGTLHRIAKPGLLR
jgi:hypothetical protein